ncbi:MAG: FG-GAP-like repeat-containing protein [Bacteroidia bacterium]|nr:FG-GAP-like repeat-containing protein [Bacteroidia bacterium]
MKKLLLFGLFPVVILSAQNQFSDVSATAGIDDKGSNYGVAVADYDKDGWEDIFIARTKDENLLYRNRGDGTFSEVAREAGLNFAGESRVAAWGDFDNDGWPDLFLGNNAGTRDKIYYNRQDGTFQDISAAAHTLTSATGNAMAVLLADVDNDGFLDIYVARMNDQNTLYHNQGDLTFEDITLASGATDTLIAMGGIFFDYDNDHDQDIYLVHDGYQANILYRNNGDLTFTNVAEAANADVKAFGMGADAGDINNDGWLDLYITNLYSNVLLLNNADGTFTDITRTAGVGDYGMGWGTFFFDADNDGWLDIYVANTPPYPNVFYHNQQDLTFLDRGEGTVLASNANSFGAVSLDYDVDGRVDIFITNSNDATGNQLFHNENINDYHWVKFLLRGTISNALAIGARVEVYSDENHWVDEINSGSGYVSQNSLILHFGLGEADFVDSVVVFWPGGIRQTYENLTVGRTHILNEGEKVNPENLQNAELTVVPNPFLDEVSIYYFLTNPMPVNIRIADLTGRTIAQWEKTESQAGIQETLWSAENHLPGIYICTCTTPEGVRQIKIYKKD